jgi:hypothetical protein
MNNRLLAMEKNHRIDKALFAKKGKAEEKQHIGDQIPTL